MDEEAVEQASLIERELRYRQILQLMPIALWQMDARGVIARLKALRADGVTDLSAHFDAYPHFLPELMDLLVITEANEQAATLFGFDHPDQLIGPVAPLWRHRPDDFRRAVQARFGGATSFECETALCCRNGQPIEVLVRITYPTPLVESGVNFAAAIDISGRVRAEARLHDALGNLAHAGRIAMLGELTATIAHEVNQPLTAIAGSARAAKRWIDRPNPDVQEVRALVENIADSADRAADIITRIRNMAVGKAGDKVELDLNSVILEAVSFLQHELVSRDVRLTLNLEGTLPSVLADRVQIQQIIVNLSMNAIQAINASARSKREIAIASRLGAAGMVEVCVEDSGPGLNGSSADELFNSFFTSKAQGMGLGLPICRSIVEDHGGTIDAGNRAGTDGARFSFRLPATPVSG